MAKIVQIEKRMLEEDELLKKKIEELVRQFTVAIHDLLDTVEKEQRNFNNVQGRKKAILQITQKTEHLNDVLTDFMTNRFFYTESKQLYKYIEAFENNLRIGTFNSGTQLLNQLNNFFKPRAMNLIENSKKVELKIGELEEVEKRIANFTAK